MGKGAERAVRTYVRALDLSSVLVAAHADGCRLRLVSTDEPAAKARALRAHVGGVIWCSSASQAEFLTISSTAELALTIDPDASGWFAMGPGQAIATICTVAEQLGVRFRTDADLTAAAVQAVAKIDTMLKEAQTRGDLKQVNADYRAYRLKAQSEGRSAMLYAGWMENYRRSLIRSAAATARMIDRESFGAICAVSG